MVAVIAVTYIIFDDAISQKEETRSFGNLAKAAAQITVVLIMLYIGFLLFIVPGVFLMLFFGFAPAYIARGHSIGESFRLSRELARGQEAPTAQALAMLALVGVFIPQIMFLICIMPMMVGIGASVAESNPKSRYVRTSSMDVPVINSPFERKKD